MRVRVLYHDHCFDGAASAAYFTRFLRETFHPEAEFCYTGMAHRASQIFEESLFDGDVNAIVDFKYSSSPKLTWWFDHHQSAFLSPEDEEHFRQDGSGRKMYDPEFKSCTGYIAAKAAEKFDYRAPDLEELVKWADIVDGAQYASAAEAVELRNAATQLVLVIEGVNGSETVQQIIRWMCRRSLDEIIGDPAIQEAYRPLYDKHLASIDIIRKESTDDGTVVFFDLTGYPIEGYSKFIPYYLFPESLYTVSVLISSFRTKVSVGSNPWAARPLKHNLATICERYGGGGHARVGAISFPNNAVEQARQAAREIVEALRREP
ncbi:MAG: phosphoesterase [Bryobacteraceae bacterium]|nr:phosphoesterase [Bryobacteraceae bacterium]